MNKDYSRKVHSVQLTGSHPLNASCQKMYTFTWSLCFACFHLVIFKHKRPVVRYQNPTILLPLV